MFELRSDKRVWWRGIGWTAGLVLVPLALHLWYGRGPRVVWGDEPFYLWLGRNWLTGHGYQFLGFNDVHHPPLYPLLSGSLYLLTGDLEWASTLLYVFFGTLLVLPMIGIGRRLYGLRAGLLTGLLVALWPALNAAIPWWGTMTEPPFLFFLALGLWAALVALGFEPLDQEKAAGLMAARRGRYWAWGLSGLSFGLAYLTRPEGIWYLPAVGAALLVSAWLGRLPWQRWLVGGLVYVAGFLLCFLPYAVYTHSQTGQWMVSEKVGITFQDSLALARNDMAEHDRILWQLDSSGEQVFFFSQESFHLSMLDQIRANARRYAGIVYLNVRSLLRMFFTLQGFIPALLPLLGLGLFAAAWDLRRLRGELVLLAALLPPLTFVFFFIFERYVSPLLLPMLVWSGLGLGRLADWLVETVANLWPRLGRRWRRLAWWLPLLTTAGLLLLLHPMTLAAATHTQAVRREHRTAGLWLAYNTPADAVVMARYPAIAFHADRRWVPSPNSDYQAALHYAAVHGVDYWVIDANENQWRPQLAFLTEEEPPPELELVYRVPTRGRPVLIYRLRSP